MSNQANTSMVAKNGQCGCLGAGNGVENSSLPQMAGPRLKGLDYLFVVSLTKMLGSQWVLLQCMKIFIIILIIS